MVENRIKEGLKVNSQQMMVVKASTIEVNKTCEVGENPISASQRLDYKYVDDPLGFEKDPIASDKRIQEQDPLEEVNLGDKEIKKPTYSV